MSFLYPPDLSDEDLEVNARRLGEATSWGAGASLDEINRRAVDRQTRQSIALTEQIRRLTDQIRWLTVGAVLLALVSLAIALIALFR